ncbi:AAA family ATPase [Sulfurospirillum halorespirans]|uniref:Putative cytidylate kinase n=1 Tax=Sulfurospirillum halorespirans DSM 13726 TaxID=1193502 RepID=A0A1D7TMQ9_9BACT|nr:cytidylate kinase-like family protein [Sulfurospirillum halorespirans]AOO66260.1 putative cytidylate kinase [Sulfurospirillum halorespirans DSM 13726]
MKEPSHTIITISRQIGSGGAFIGQKLAKELGMSYVDREIITQAAKEFSLVEEDLESLDEKTPSFWQCFFQSSICSPDVYLPPQLFVPTEEAIFKVETKIIKQIAKDRSAIIIGRCGSHILRDNPNHLSIFLHADATFRKKRIEELYKVSGKEAERMIEQSDGERARYHQLLVEKPWSDASQYDLCINTSKIGIDSAIALIRETIERYQNR